MNLPSISWLSWVKIIKKLTKEIFLPVLLFFEVVFFWSLHAFGTGFLNGLIALLIISGSLYFYIVRRKEAAVPLIFLALFLGFTALFYLHFAFNFPLWLSELFVFLFSLLLFFYLCYEDQYLKNSLLFASGLLVCLLEVFFILSFWPTNPLSKSFILTSIFYLFWYVIVKREKPLSYLILATFALFVVVLTTRWPVL